MAGLLCVAAPLDQGSIPTKASIFNYYLQVRSNGIKSGRWKLNTPLSELSNVVLADVKIQWDKTHIFSIFSTDPVKVQRMIMNVLTESKAMMKIPVAHREQNFGSKLNTLLDMADCSHSESQACNCNCPASMKVPVTWQHFLQDQHGPWVKVQG